jgi:hypothetical protein
MDLFIHSLGYLGISSVQTSSSALRSQVPTLLSLWGRDQVLYPYIKQKLGLIWKFCICLIFSLSDVTIKDSELNFNRHFLTLFCSSFHHEYNFDLLLSSTRKSSSTLPHSRRISKPCKQALRQYRFKVKSTPRLRCYEKHRDIMVQCVEHFWTTYEGISKSFRTES